MTEDKLWKADDVADYLGVSKSLVYRMSAEGLLPTIHITGKGHNRPIRFNPNTIKQWAEAQYR